MRSLDSISEAPFSPANALTEWIEAQGFTQKDASLVLQWTAPELSMVLGGKRPISERMARDLAEKLGDVPKYKGWAAEDWMELQREFTAWVNRPDAEAEIWARKQRVGVLCDADILDAVKSGLLRIDPFDEAAVQPASYDPKPGTVSWFKRVQRGGGRRKITLTDEEEVAVVPGETVLIVVKEKIRLPSNMIGRLASAGSLVEMGVQFAFGIQMEPGWSGYPFFTLTHNGEEEITLGAAYGCASIQFEFLQRPARRPFGKAERPTKFAG